MQITFLGAAGEVTGSQHLVETETLRVLLDCGLFQGDRAESYAKNGRFQFDPADLDGVILSHGHIDHCGNLPGLYRAGFRGSIFCTEATADVATLMLRDSSHIQQEDLRYLQRHVGPEAGPLEPLYDENDVRETIRLLEPLPYDEWHELSAAFRLRFSDAGHILGSAVCEMQIEDGGERRRVVYTGDLGHRGMPLLPDPSLVGGCDVLISESTYGNRIHPPADRIKAELLWIISNAATNNGRVIIPAFSLGRTQQIVFFLNQLTEEELLPEIPVFVDSPLATRITEVYRHHQQLLKPEARRWLEIDDDLFGFPGLHYVASQRESIELNRRKGPFVVISASGMCDAGRVQHHLKHAVTGTNNAVVIVGYQAEQTLGRRLVDGAKEVRILGEDYPVHADVAVLQGLSAHADAEDFKWWFDHMASETGIGRAFLVHGEADAAQSLSGLIRDCCDEDPVIPAFGESFEA